MISLVSLTVILLLFDAVGLLGYGLFALFKRKDRSFSLTLFFGVANSSFLAFLVYTVGKKALFLTTVLNLVTLVVAAICLCFLVAFASLHLIYHKKRKEEVKRL